MVLTAIQQRDNWVPLMLKRLRKVFTFELENADVWKPLWQSLESDLRREEVGEYATPDVVKLTPEGAPLANLTMGLVRLKAVVHGDYTGMITITHQMRRDNKYNDIEKNTWGLSEAVARCLAEEATKPFYQGFSTYLSGDDVPWFGTNHPLANAPGKYGSNYVAGVLGPDTLRQMQQQLMETLNENGKPISMGSGKLQLAVAPYNHILAQQLADPNQYLPGSNEFNRNKFNITPITIPFFIQAPSAIRDGQAYLRDPLYAENTHYLREGPTFDMVQDPVTQNVLAQTRIAFSFVVPSWRGTVGLNPAG